MIIYDCEQRSPEWYALRTGVITASNAHRLLTPAKRKTYQMELLAEILTGQLQEHYVSDAMQWGIDKEPDAIELYKQLYPNRLFAKHGFVMNEDIPYVGCSPDLVMLYEAKEGFTNVEVKCLSSKNHLEAYQGEIDSDYMAQIQFQMLVMGIDFSHYVGYDPRFAKVLNLYVKPVQRNESIIGKLEDGIKDVNYFINEFLMEHGLPREPRKLISEQDEGGFF